MTIREFIREEIVVLLFIVWMLIIAGVIAYLLVLDDRLTKDAVVSIDRRVVVCLV